jgi:predicted DNA binding protein
VAKSSLSMTLRRAERALATRYLEDRDLVDRLSTPA